MTYIQRDKLEEDKEKLLKFLEEETRAENEQEKVILLKKARDHLAEKLEKKEHEPDYNYFK
ncbi:MAG: hypothetical protein ABEJ83_05680 [Candidatus Nanohaloarchaea archaeon]